MRSLLVAVLGTVLMTSMPPAQGQRIPAKDGDLILVNSGAQVRVLRRGDATIRAIFNPAQHWLVILADYAAPNGASDGGVDVTYTFHELTGEWPMGERWEGKAVLEEYSVAGEIGHVGLGVALPGGLVQLFDLRGEKLFRDASAASVISVRGSSRGGSSAGGGGNQSFDVEERMQVAQAIRSAQMRAALPADARRSFSSATSLSFEGIPPAPPSGAAPPRSGDAPVRVGGNISPPRRIQDAAGILPDLARQAGVRGIVVVEITIAPDGTIRDAKILRSIPLLDQAALDAVRQWRYEPTLLNGTPVPVILTATVSFQ
jgi:TonB family protein